MNKICILGLGYIGLPTAGILAAKGFHVSGVDTNKNIVKMINQAKLHITEPGLGKLVRKVVRSGFLRANVNPDEADVFIICVPTPLKKGNKSDLSYIKEAGRSILPYLKKGNLVILESTVPPGTTRDVLIPILERSGLKVGKDLMVSHCPERVLPGKILKEVVQNDRLIGGIDSKSNLLAKKIYKTFVKGNIYLTDATTAEMVKLTENSFRDINIAFANEISKICDRLKISVWDVISFANRHPRVNIHKPGPGVGGHCIAVDPYFIKEVASKEAILINTARKINNGMPGYVVSKVEKILKRIKNSIIACFGITYKADVSDLRQSPSLEIVKRLIKKRYKVRVCDPNIKYYPEFKILSMEKAIKGADCCLILVDHEQFKRAKWERLLSKMRHKNIIDIKRIF
ncbi:UDP-N-acetyl-D-mannosamine dehydrogenase [bacterium]|nr:UDP-N-acetyl-D-mannosamine dehydrogenase [bacterium]